MDRKLSPISMRLMLVMYISQNANVRLGKSYSTSFSITHGVKQGAVLSAVLFCVYIDDLIKTLRKKKTGYWINNSYVGNIVYADDIVLLSPSIDGLQEIINTCSDIAGKHNLCFSTHKDQKKSKTKCMTFIRKKKEVPLRKMMLDDKPLPWVKTVIHLGENINDRLIRGQDTMEKRAQYVAQYPPILHRRGLVNNHFLSWKLATKHIAQS